MSYSRRNLLKRIIKIQDIVNEQKKHGVTQKWVYDHLIAEPFNISYSTFNNYLSYPAKMEMTKVKKTEALQFSLGL